MTQTGAALADSRMKHLSACPPKLHTCQLLRFCICLCCQHADWRHFACTTDKLCLLQAHNVQLGLAEMTVVACTATLAAIGAAAIPSAGLVTMLMVMQAVSLDQFASDLAVILAIDWLLDRCRTAVNVMGDAFAVVLVDSMCKEGAKQTHNIGSSGHTVEMF